MRTRLTRHAAWPLARCVALGIALLAPAAGSRAATPGTSATAAASATPPGPTASLAPPVPPEPSAQPAVTASTVAAQAYAPPQRQVRYNGAVAFRSLIPSSVLEQLTGNEYHRLVQAAAQSGQLLPASDARVKRVNALVARLAPYSVKWSDRIKGWNWEVNVIRSRKIQVICLPGGKVLVDSGMLDRLRLNDNELGVLLAHEIAHALREHARASLGEQQAAQFGTTSLPSLFGLAEPLPEPLGIGERLASMRYSSTDETEADVIGGDIAARAGFDPRAALTLWDKLAAATRADKDTGFIYLHPYDTHRRQDLLKRLGDLMPLYAKAIGKPLGTLPDYAGISTGSKRLVGR